MITDRRTPSKPRRIDYFPDEFLVGTTDLTLEEAGAYWKVCSLIYSRGGPVHDDDRWIAKAIATDVRKWKPIRARLLAKGKLIRADGKLSNARCETELAKVRRRIEDAHTNGALGGRPPGQSPGDVGEMSARSPGDPPTCDPTSPGHLRAISEPDSLESSGFTKPKGSGAEKPNHQPPTTNHSYTVDQEEMANRFETFWRTFPSRRPHPNPKKPARLKFEAAVGRGVDSTAIIAGAERYAAYVRQHEPNPRYWKQAVTWLNQELWTETYEQQEPRLVVGMI